MAKQQAIFPTQTDWHTVPLTHLESSTSTFGPDNQYTISQLKDFAHSLLEEDVRRYQASCASSTSSRRFLSTIIASGTLQDKVSALTLAIQESPVHNVKAFESLLGLASKKNRTQASGALGALVDLLGPGSVLPSSRKLRYFSSQPALQALCGQGIHVNQLSRPPYIPLTDIALISCVFEDWLKATYFKIILLLERWCSNDVEYSRMKGLDYAYILLREKPEQESNLLRLLIDRLGDRSGKVSSRASFLIRQLQPLHPGMTATIIDTIDNMLLKDPATCMRTRYNAMITLNQTVITSTNAVIAKKLISIYFQLFRLLLEAGFVSEDPNARKKTHVPDVSDHIVTDQGNIDKLISSILTGLNRALPFVKVTDREDIYAHVDTLFQVAQSPNFNASIQALMLLHKLCDNLPQIVDRFFSQVYESLLDPRLITSSKQVFYLNLLTRVVRSDHDPRRIKAFAKRMVQACDLHQAPFVSGVLYILSLAKQDSPDLSTLIDNPEDRSTESVDCDSEIYDGWKRFPQFSNAHRSALWELEPLTFHFHPAITHTANALATGKNLTQKPDLDHLTLMRFLDKFALKKPKSVNSGRGGSIMQPRDIGDGAWIGARSIKSPNKSKTTAQHAFDPNFVEDNFYHEYLKINGVKSTIRQISAAIPLESESHPQEDEEEIWRALISTQSDADEGLLTDSDVGILSDIGSIASDMESDVVHGESESDFDIDACARDRAPLGNEQSSPTLSEPPLNHEDQDSSMVFGHQAKRRRLLRTLPTFALADDYAKMLAGDGLS